MKKLFGITKTIITLVLVTNLFFGHAVYAAMSIPIQGVDIEGFVTESTTSENIGNVNVEILYRSEISYYIWEDDDGTIYNDCEWAGGYQVDSWCYFSLYETTTNQEGFYSFDKVDVCDVNPNNTQYDLQFSKDGYGPFKISNLDYPCGQTVVQDVSLDMTVPDWRKDIQVGDILYDPYAAGVGHVGTYVGEGYVIEAQGSFGPEKYPGTVNMNRIESWDNPSRKTVYLLRVQKPDFINENAWIFIKQSVIDFIAPQEGKPYDWSWYKKQVDIDSPSWYCSELVWAAWYNQGIDLEHKVDGALFDLLDPVSPVEIFDDTDTYVVSSHLEGYDDVPWYRQYGILFVLSPVDIIIRDINGNVVDQNNMGIPGVTFIQDQVDGNGHTHDIIYLPYSSEGYTVEVVKKPDAEDDETYSLKLFYNNQTTWLTQDNQVPSEDSSHEYQIQLSGSSPVLVNGYTDTEKSLDNNMFAGSIDISFSNQETFEDIYPGQNSLKDIVLNNDGTMDAQYTIEATNFVGDMCQYLDVTVYINGNQQYQGLLSVLDFSSPLLLPNQSDIISLELSLNSSDSSIWQQKCDFDLEAVAWSNELNDPSQGFSDVETTSSSVKAGVWGVVMNEILPNPDGFDYGFDFGQDHSHMPQGEWVELYNNDILDHDLNGWRIEDFSGHEVLITADNTYPAGTTISGNGYLVVFMNKQIINNAGKESITLYNDSDGIIDSYSYKDGEYCELEPTAGEENADNPSGSCDNQVEGNKSIARIPDGIGEWIDPVPTPSTSNTLDSQGKLIVLDINTVYEAPKQEQEVAIEEQKEELVEEEEEIEEIEIEQAEQEEVIKEKEEILMDKIIEEQPAIKQDQEIEQQEETKQEEPAKEEDTEEETQEMQTND